jgi:hypothetical protein
MLSTAHEAQPHLDETVRTPHAIPTYPFFYFYFYFYFISNLSSFRVTPYVRRWVHFLYYLVPVSPLSLLALFGLGPEYVRACMGGVFICFGASGFLVLIPLHLSFSLLCSIGSDTVILGGISILSVAYFILSTGNELSRKIYGTKGALEHQHARASDETGAYLIKR